jgi:NAD(P)-dependent dehydrogenase (short-subunit alcohol dehydrogenase family)
MPELGHCQSGVGIRAATLWAEDIGLLDILINNAAAYVDWSEMASTADFDAAERVMQVNLFGSWRMIQAFCRC